MHVVNSPGSGMCPHTIMVPTNRYWNTLTEGLSSGLHAKLFRCAITSGGHSRLNQAERTRPGYPQVAHICRARSLGKGPPRPGYKVELTKYRDARKSQ